MQSQWLTIGYACRRYHVDADFGARVRGHPRPSRVALG